MAANPRHIILRTAWLYAPYGHNFLRTVLRLAQEQSRLRLIADQKGNPTYAPHLAHALLGTVLQFGAHSLHSPVWGIYHAAGEGETTWAGFGAEILATAAQYGFPRVPITPIATCEYPAPAKRPANSRLDCAKLQRVFGLKLPAWRSGIMECIARLFHAEKPSESRRS